MVESGFFYSTFIDPVLRSLREKVAAHVSCGESVIDIACGTGAQVFKLSEKVKRSVGADLSESMIAYARKEGEIRGVTNADFVVVDVTDLSQFAENEFDVAVLSLALHQFDSEIYPNVLSEMKRISQRIIIVDYTVPLPKNIAGITGKTIEYLAGREHFRNFRKYYHLGGLLPLLEKNGLSVHSSEALGGGVFSLVVCSG